MKEKTFLNIELLKDIKKWTYTVKVDPRSCYIREECHCLKCSWYDEYIAQAKEEPLSSEG